MSTQTVDPNAGVVASRRRRGLLIELGIAVLAFVWFAFSSAEPLVLVLPAALVFVAAVVIWLAWAIVSLAGKTRPRPKGWMAVGIILAVTAGGGALNVPVKARFAVSEPAFNRFVEKAGPPPAVVQDDNSADLECPPILGLYIVSYCEVTDGGYLFFDPLGNALVDYAGFAYLPNGPYLKSDGAFEVQEVVHLHGDWYAFAASW